MTWLALGALALLGVLALLRAFANASVVQVRKVAVWGAAIAGTALILLFLFTGRGAQALWWGVLLGPAAWRSFQGWRLRRRFGAPAGGGPATAVETRHLSMRVDHGSGIMTGEVTAGRFAGRALADLQEAELRALLDELRRDDPEGVPLLEAWLDRAAPGWRDAPRATAAAMDRAEALAVLGLPEGATPAEVRAAHRRLMQAAHPDRGGSDWLAARLNEARDVLLATGG
jgi:hypothetical protein